MLNIIIAALLFLLPFVLLLNGLWTAILLPLLVVAMGAIVPKTAWKDIWSAPRGSLVVWGVFLLWPLASAMWASHPSTALSSFSGLISIVFLAWLGGLLVTHVNLHIKSLTPMAVWMGWGALFAALCFLAAALLQQGPLYYLLALSEGGFRDFYDGTANRGIAVWAVLVWPLSLALWQHSHRYLAVAVLLSVGAAVISSQSLSAAVAFWVALLTFGFIRLWPRYGRLLLLFGLPALLYLWPLGFSHWMTAEHKQIVKESSIPLSAKHRVYIWDFALDTWHNHPLIGIGMNNARHLPNAEELSDLGLVNLPMHPHNNMIQMLLELGLVGFSAFLLAWFFAIKHGVLTHASAMVQATIGAVFVSYAAVGMTGFNAWQSWWMAAAALAYIFTKICIKTEKL